MLGATSKQVTMTDHASASELDLIGIRDGRPGHAAFE
jgi:hypothetical protein